MSALQEILDRMYIDPTLLDQLADEQKQILFIKMREEQLRRWHEREEILEAQERMGMRPPKASTSSNGKRIQWLTGEDGEVWVWVMGEHSNDVSIEQKLEEEARRKAHVMAEKELIGEKLRNLTSNSASNSRATNASPLLSCDTSVGLLDSAPKKQADHPSPYDLVDSDPTLLAKLDHHSNRRRSLTPTPSTLPHSQQPPPVPPRPRHLQPLKGPLNSTIGMTSIADSSVPVAERPLAAGRALRRETAANGAGLSLATSVISYGQDLSPTADRGEDIYDNLANLMRPVARNATDGRANDRHYAVSSQHSLYNAALTLAYNSNNNNNINSLVPQTMNGSLLSPASSVRNRPSIGEAELEKRESKILEQIHQARRRLEQEADVESTRQRNEWEEQERRAKDAERQIRLIAQRARQAHQASLRTSSSLLPFLDEKSTVPFKEAIKKLARPPKPKSRAAILQWFRESERPDGAGLLPGTSKPAPWMHGIISRAEAEALLSGRRKGSFLVRPSEKIFGYAVSYADGGSGQQPQSVAAVVRHFLIERVPDGAGYQFLGTNQIVHESLYKLVAYHEKTPITAQGKELLLYPVGPASGRGQRPSYAELYDTSQAS